MRAIRVRSRRETYALLVGVTAGILVAGLMLPMLVGDASDAPRTVSATGSAAGGSAPVTTVADAGATTESTAPALAPPNLRADRALGGRDPHAGSGSGGGAVGAAATRRASDVGVTADTIKVGFIVLDLGGGGQVGLDFGIDPQQQEGAIRAAVDGVNAAGGVHGRRIEPSFAVNDVTDTFTGGDSGRAACLKLTEDDKVFAVVGYLLPPDQLCVTREHRTPLVSDAANVLDVMVSESEGRLISLYPRASRIMADWAARLAQSGFITGKKIGIVDDQAIDPGGASADNLAAVLKRSGHTVVRTSRLSNQLSQAASQMPIEVNQQRTSGAEVVLFLSNPLYVQQFIQEAESQRWVPKYGFSDYGNGVADPANDFPDSMHGAFGVGGAHPGVGTHDFTGWPEPPAAVRCRDNYEKRAGEKLQGRGQGNEYSITLLACDDVTIFSTIATVTGVELTRSAFVAAVARVGALEDLGSRRGGAFGPGKSDLNDYTRLMSFEAACNCWRPRGGFQPVAA